MATVPPGTPAHAWRTLSTHPHRAKCPPLACFDPLAGCSAGPLLPIVNAGWTISR